ncbi:hypothetical protein [Enterovirga rhinocerotis]|uniref:Uncharacterized protein n=1 Tax=Enterovirga rhinocerotis TaxID=1339210 RepID=A0A4R7C716_9HYPH|nr:hypothetical protein [Enterovirga rhinocerotis]TDR93943.1 hypothetical protein EV668_1212 [Enterovirga rhinocerotis]
MRRERSRLPFPYAERARAVEQARNAVNSAFQAMKAAGAARNDPTAVEALAWRAAARQFHVCIERAYPPLFWDCVGAVRRGERSGLDEVIGFLEADPWFFRSGYVKADILVSLKRVALERGHERRLRAVLLAVVDGRDRREFRSYCHLAPRLATPEFRRELAGRAASPDRAVARRGAWMLAALGRAEP